MSAYGKKYPGSGSVIDPLSGRDFPKRKAREKSSIELANEKVKRAKKKAEREARWAEWQQRHSGKTIRSGSGHR